MSVLNNLVFKLNKQDLSEPQVKIEENKNQLYAYKKKQMLDLHANNGNLSRALSGVSSKLKDAFDDLVQLSKIDNFDVTQDFKMIQKLHNKKNPFVDVTFPPSNKSVFYSDSFKNSLKLEGKLEEFSNRVIWKRAVDLCSNAHFSIDNHGNSIEDTHINENNYKKFFATTDLDQGLVGNCWFVSGATGVLQNFNLFQRVIPFKDNTFKDDRYTGAFHFRFWLYGEWKDVVVDDYLPVDRNNKLLFCKNRDTPNEFWSSLLEKAYAKVCGSYEALEGGFTSEALIDMSGGIEEVYNLNDLRTNKMQQLNVDKFWDILTSAKKKCSVIGCNIELKHASDTKEYKMSNGLVQGHAYVVTNVTMIRLSTNTYVRLLRIYNPWGNDAEWNGSWSDLSSKWSLVDNETKESLELKIKNDGEFYMCYEDWLSNFDHCQICNLTPESCCDLTHTEYETQKLLSSLVSMWQPSYYHGEWSLANDTCGGRGEHNQAKFWSNPQYSFIISESDLISDDACWVIISLMQKNTRKRRNDLKISQTTNEEYIQYRLFKSKLKVDEFTRELNNGQSILWHNQLDKIGSSGPYINKREVTQRFKLKHGAYIIVPSVYDEHIQGEFLLRIFTEKPLVKRSFKTQKRRLTVFNHNGVDESLSEMSAEFSQRMSNLIANDCLKKEKRFSVIDALVRNDCQTIEKNKRNSHRPSVDCNQM